MALVNYQHKKATKAALGLLVGTRGHTARSAALAAQQAQEELGLQVGNLCDLSAKERYAQGIRAKGERTSNRKWGNYPSEVAQLAQKVAERGETLFDGFYCA